MLSYEELNKVIDELNVTRKATIAEFLYSLFKDKIIEVYLGDAYEDISTEQVSTTYPAVFSGKVIGAYKECLVLEATYIDRKAKQTKVGKKVFISERAIRGLAEVDGNGVFDDLFLRSREALEYKTSIHNK